MCEILVALQGRSDAARLFGQRLEQLIVKAGGRRSIWDPKVYFFHNGPLKDTDATLEQVISACEAALAESGSKRKQGEAPPGWAMIATHVDDVPGVATSDAMIEFILGAIRVVYACEMAPWKKVLGFKITVNESDGTVQMSCEAVIETMYRTYLKGQLTYDAKLPMRDVDLESGVVPPLGDPDRAPFLQMQTETRSMLGLLIWVSIAYPQISMATNKGCGHMANPSWSVNAFAKHIIMHLYQYPLPRDVGG